MAEITLYSHLATRSTRVKLDMKELERLIKEEPARAKKIVKATAFQVEGEAKVRAPVDTGALKGSIHTVTASFSNFQGRVRTLGARAERLSGSKRARTRKRGARLGNVMVEELPKPSSDYIAHVGSAVEYAIYVEFGTSRTTAQPFLVPAAEAVRDQFNARWQELFK